MGQYLLVDESDSESDDELDKPIYPYRPPIQYQKKAWSLDGGIQNVLSVSGSQDTRFRAYYATRLNLQLDEWVDINQTR